MRYTLIMILFFIGCSDPEPLDCAGVEGGDAIYDQCDICDGDGTSCIGCMELEACNYDLTAIVDDGSCWYSHSDCECVNGIDAIPTGQMSGWKIRIGAEMLAYNIFSVKDSLNYIGVSEDATNGYDEGIDIPEPPSSPGNFISLYSANPDWNVLWGGELQANFTENIKSTVLCGTNKQWNLELYSNAPGLCTLIFDFLDEINLPCQNSPLTMVVDNISYDLCDGFSHSLTLNENSAKNITIVLTP